MRCEGEEIAKKTKALSDIQQEIQKELDNPKEIFVNDSFTHGKQKTSEWAYLGEKGKKIENWINKKFNASRDKTSTAFNAGAKKAIEKINSWTGSKIPEQWADFLVQPNSPMRKHLDEINADTQLRNQRLDMNEHYTFSLLEKYPKEQIENVAKALDGQIKAENLSEAEKPLYDKIRNTIDKKAQKLVELGVLKEEHQIKDYLKHYYDYYTREGAEISGAIRSSKLGIDKTHKRKNVSDERAAELGGLRMDAYAIVKTISEQERQIQKAIQLKNLADRFGSDVEIEGWVKISDESLAGGVKKYGELGGKWVEPELARFIDELEVVSASQNFVVKNLVALGGMIKTNMTALNPGTHLFNILSNLSLSVLNGDLKSVISLAKIKKGGGAEYKDWQTLAQWYGLNGNMKAIDFDKAHGIKAAAVSKGKKIYNATSNLWFGENSTLGEVFRNVYNLEDSVFKIAHFKRLMGSTDFDIKKAFKNGVMDKEYLAKYEEQLKDAMKRGNYNYVDYSTRWSKAAQGLDKVAVLPFIQYSWKAGPMVLRSIAQNLIKYAALLGTTYGFGGLSLGTSEDKEAKNLFLPKWAKSSQMPNLMFQENWVKFGDVYFNLGRMTPGVRIDGFNGINFDFGFLGGIGHLLKGESSLGYKYLDEDKNGFYQNGQILLALLENYAPPLSPVGRYGQRAIKMVVNSAYDDKEKPFKVRDSMGQELSWGKYFARLVGVREMPEKAEAQKALNANTKKLKAAIKEGDKAKAKELQTKGLKIIELSKKAGYSLKVPK